MAGEYRNSATVVYYEMPVLESVPRLLRGLVLKKIGESVPEPARDRFLPVLDHEANWKNTAGFVKADDAYVLVVDGGGAVTWKMEGRASPAAMSKVMQQVERTRDAMAQSAR